MSVIVGVDPGETTGICVLPYGATGVDGAGAWLLQVNAAGALGVLEQILTGWGPRVEHIAVEHFVVGRRAARSAGAGGQVTRDLLANVVTLGAQHRIPVARRTASQVKTWATDRRLDRAGLVTPKATGYRHARDGARHALLSAVADHGCPDPLGNGENPTGLVFRADMPDEPTLIIGYDTHAPDTQQ